MGAGRKIETYTLCHDQYPGYYELPARKLAKEKLGAVIFGCTHSTMNECISKQLFGGLPAPHYDYVRNVKPGLPLFLFNYSDRNLYGIFEATSHGQMNIDPNGWTAHGSGRTLYPAQVRVRVRQECQLLIESQYKPIIAANYSNSQHFMFELDHACANSKRINIFSMFFVMLNFCITHYSTLVLRLINSLELCLELH